MKNMLKIFYFSLIFILCIPSLGQKEISNNRKIDSLREELSFLQKSEKELKTELSQIKKSEFIDNMTVWITIFSSIGAFLAFLGVWIGLRTLIRNQTNEFLKRETEKELNEIVEKKYGEVLSEIELKKNAKVLVINEKNTEIPKIFNELLKDYPNLQYFDILNIDGFKDEVLINSCKLYDLIIIEDMVPGKRWLVNPRNLVKFDGGEGKLKENNDKLVEFCKKVSPTSAVLYYGDGLLAKESIGNHEIEQFIFFANAPASLLQSTFNLIKLHSIGKSLFK